MHLGYVAATALACGLDGDPAPPIAPPLASVPQLDDAALGLDCDDLRCTELGGVANHCVELVALADALQERRRSARSGGRWPNAFHVAAHAGFADGKHA